MGLVKEKKDLGQCATCDFIKLVTVTQNKEMQKRFMCYSYPRRPFLIIRPVSHCYSYKPKWEQIKLPKKTDAVPDSCSHAWRSEVKNRQAKQGRKIYLCDRKEGKHIILTDLNKCKTCASYSRKPTVS